MADDLVPYRSGMEYGIGIDSPSGDARNVGVLGGPTTIPNAGGSIVEYELTQVSSDEDLQTSLGVSASASGGVGLFSASASMDFAQKCHVHSNSVFLLASVKVNLAFAQIREPAIKPEAAAKLGDGDPTRFQEMYGDSFVRGLQTGGRFFSVVEIFTSSKTEQESLSISVKGSYGLFSGQASFSSEFSQAVSNRSLKITTHHEGGVVPKEPTSLEDVQAIASGFAATVEGHAVPYGVLLDKYTILDLPNPPNYIDLQHQMDVLAYCARQRNALWTALNEVDYILDNPGQFTDAPGADDAAPLVAYRAALTGDLDTVARAASAALQHPRDATLPALSASAPTMPKRREGESDALAAAGESLVSADALAAALCGGQPAGAARRGFYVGMAAMNGHTLWGPGAQSIKDSLDPAGQIGFAEAAAYCLQRNNNSDVARRGAAVLSADPAAKAGQAALPLGLAWLGFAVASGIFGNPALGALGNTATGPGSLGIRGSLDTDGQRGFDSAVAFHLAKKYV
jgi:hypothetical protein